MPRQGYFKVGLKDYEVFDGFLRLSVHRNRGEHKICADYLPLTLRWQSAI